MVIRGLRKHVRFPSFREALIGILTAMMAAIGSAGDATAVVDTPYLGCVSNLGRAADNVSTDYTRSMAVTTRTAEDNITRPRVLHHNYYSNTSNTAERAPGGTCTYTDWIEYPIGVAYHGGATATAADGGHVVNDLGTMPVTIPRGALFRIWTLREGAQVWTGGRGSWHLGAGYLASPGVSERVPQLGHVFYPGAAWVNTYWPTVLDETNRRSVLFIDNSHGMGEGERGEPDLTGFYGYLERYFRNRCGWTNMSTRGMSLQSFIASHTNRVAIAQYYSDIYIGLGGNDVNASRTLGQILADLDTVIGYYPGKYLLSGTEPPKTSSTDGYTTEDGQTPLAVETVGRAFSREKQYGRRFHKIFDWCVGVAFMKTNGQMVFLRNTVADGSHMNAYGAQLAANGVPQTPIFPP